MEERICWTKNMKKTDYIVAYYRNQEAKLESPSNGKCKTHLVKFFNKYCELLRQCPAIWDSTVIKRPVEQTCHSIHLFHLRSNRDKSLLNRLQQKKKKSIYWQSIRFTRKLVNFQNSDKTVSTSSKTLSLPQTCALL